MTPYQVLGLQADASVEQAKKAYRKLAQRFHPDRNRNPSAENRFKEVQAAWEKIQAGWKPEVTKPPPAASPGFDPGVRRQHVTVRASFRDTFMGNPQPIFGTPFVVIPPYGVVPGTTHRQLVKTIDGRHQDWLDVTWDVHDPNNFYKLEVVGKTTYLSCKVIVSAASVLAGQEVNLPNINPQVGSLNVKLKASSPLTVPNAGLYNPETKQRMNLLVHLDIQHKDLKDERYDTLVDLKKKVEEAMGAASNRFSAWNLGS